jgi:hypothetical protein
MSITDSMNTAPDVAFKPAGVGLGITTHCDVCRRPLSTTKGCTRPPPTRLLHCEDCTAARKLPRHNAHVLDYKRHMAGSA